MADTVVLGTRISQEAALYLAQLREASGWPQSRVLDALLLDCAARGVTIEPGAAVVCVPAEGAR